MKTYIIYIRQFLCIAVVFLTTSGKGQGSDISNFLRDKLMVYYVEDPSSDQFRLLNLDEITSGQQLFGGNHQLDIAQTIIREIFIPAEGTAFQESIVQALRRQDRPLALFLYYDRGPLDEAVASANWTNCIANGHFTSCVTSETDDEYAAIIHYGADQMNSDGILTAKNRLLSLMGVGEEGNLSEIQEGIVLTFYTNYVRAGTSFNQGSHDEFERYARKFSQQHNAVALIGTDLIRGANAAMPILTVEEIVDKAIAVLSKLRRDQNNPNLQLGTIAILTHGLTNYVNFGNRNFVAIDNTIAQQKNGGNPPDAYETAETFASALNPLLSEEGKLIFYACLSGSSVSDEVWETRQAENLRRRTMDYESNGEGSVAKAIKNYLNINGSNRQVWAHRTTAHTVGNPVWRLFKGPSGSGRLYEDLPFLMHHPIYSDKGTQYLARLVKAKLEELNAPAVTQEEVRIWIGQEIPFVSNAFWPFITSEPENYRRPADYHFKSGLIDLYARRWLSQNEATP